MQAVTDLSAVVGIVAACDALGIAVPGRASARAASDSGCYVNSRAAGERRPF
jgi:hypothetical protein